jgi:hypothetical protein
MNAYCNLMVSWKSSSETMFASRELWVFNQLSIELPIKLRSEGPPTMMKYFSIEQDLWATEVSHSPLNRRAWVMQECFLSRLNLHFSMREVF